MQILSRMDRLVNGVRFISEHHLRSRRLSDCSNNVSMKLSTRKSLNKRAYAKLSTWQTTLKIQLVVGKHFGSPAWELALCNFARVYLPSSDPHKTRTILSLRKSRHHSLHCTANLRKAHPFSLALLQQTLEIKSTIYSQLTWEQCLISESTQNITCLSTLWLINSVIDFNLNNLN